MTVIVATLLTLTGGLVPYELKCESLTDPVGIARAYPMFSWKVRAADAGARNLRQTAYRIRVSNNPTALSPEGQDVWDSGKVTGSATNGILYGGRALKSGERLFWSVQTWDGKGQPSAWSNDGTFTVGLLKQSDWKAQWIAFDAPDQGGVSPLSGANWIWMAGEEKLDSLPGGTHEFETTFAIPAAIRSAELVVTADDQFDARLNDQPVGASDDQTDAWRRFKTLDVMRAIQPGTNHLVIRATNSSAGYAGAIAKLTVTFADGTKKVIATNGTWKAEGNPVRVIGGYGRAPWGRLGESRIMRPSTLYRRDFFLKPGLKRALAHVTALGLVDLHLNGHRVAEDRFTPGWTDYHKRVYARTFDVTDRLRVGTNAVGAELGDGWYSGYVGYGGHRAWYGERPRVRVQLDLEYLDGHHETVGSSTNWKASTGMTRVQDFLIGEEADARLAQPWDAPGFNDASWKRPYAPKVSTPVEPFPGQPVRAYATLRATSVTRKPDGYVIDFGQNLAGVARLKLKGRPGEKVVLRYAEVLDPQTGDIYTDNLRGARAIDTYTFRGRDVETWEPRFTFHGFRYIKVSGLDRAPTADEISAVAISSDNGRAGLIETSDPMLNKLAKNAWWTQKMNFIDVPTDCPQRDERLGWTGDAQAYIRTASTFENVHAFFEKWLVALDDDQRKDGQFPMVAPQIVAGDDGGPAWADAGVICPWTIYQVYGDRRLLMERYPAMKKFVEFCRKRSTPDLLPPKEYHCFGDWLSINANTPNDVIYESYFAGSTRIVARAAAALGLKEDAAKYDALYKDIRKAFNKAYVTPDGMVAGNTQCAYVLALGFDLLDAPVAKLAAKRLVDDIKSRNWHLSTGFVGTRDLMQVLSKIGRNDVAFKLLHNTTFPSWGFEIVNGATTVWERWDGWTPEKGFQDAGMNSFAHYAYGAVMGWVFANVGGIDAAAPGFETLKIAPKFDPHLTWANTRYESVRGPVSTSWKRANGRVAVTIDVPANTTATIVVPGKAKETTGITGTGGAESTTFRVGSGTYHFTTTDVTYALK